MKKMRISQHKLYLGSIVLGLNDAIIEATGTVAGLTLILHDTKIIALTSLITGIAAALSMAASEYLEKKTEKTKLNPINASIYTGISYLITVIIIIIPYFILKSLLLSFGLAILNSVIIIFIFTYHTSKDERVSFKKKFLEMLVISLGIATLTFVIGFLIKNWFIIP